jgi:flagellar hook protein FlgE
MMRGMFSAISGLRVHQTMLDVTANNIANVNTIGFKGERTSFKDALSQTSRAASAPTAAGLGGTNAAQIGLGVQLGGIDNMMASGAVQSTGSALDVAIQGDGFFRISSDLAPLTDGNAATPATNVMYTRAGNFTRDANGRLVTPEGYYVVGFAVDPTTGAVTPALPAANEIAITIPATAQAVSIGQDGVVTTVDAAGTVTKVGAISMAKFANDAGLERVSGNKFRLSNNSGAATVNQPGAAGNGILIPGAVEMSNIDLAQEFTNMITAQRGFQANSRIISASDEMLTELVNLKR